MHDRATRLSQAGASEPPTGENLGCAPTLAPPEGGATPWSARPEPRNGHVFESSAEIVESIAGRDLVGRGRDSMREHLGRCLQDRAEAREGFRTEPPTWRSRVGQD